MQAGSTSSGPVLSERLADLHGRELRPEEKQDGKKRPLNLVAKTESAREIGDAVPVMAVRQNKPDGGAPRKHRHFFYQQQH